MRSGKNSRITPEKRENLKKFARLQLIGDVDEFYLSFEWATILFGVGIGLYFALPVEPSLVALLGSICVIAVGLFLAKQTRTLPYALILVSFCVLLGLGRAAWHTRAVGSPKMPAYERAYDVSGWVRTIETSGSRLRWEIVVQNIEGLNTQETPYMICTTATGEGIQAGDGVNIRAVLSAPPGPAVPKGYDPARRAYYEKIGAYGYSISKAERVDIGVLPLGQRIERAVVKFRHGLADRILRAAPQKTAGLQTSLLTGIRTYIPEAQTEALREAGLAHILAISGLHMGLVAFGIFSLMTFIFACITPLSRRYDVRKFAAVFGAAAATFYLILSGSSVATQRAYVMVMIVFLAVMLDRRAISMRSVALAALITLLWHPEALLSAGFQMSFAAVSALVVVYRYWDMKRDYRPGFAAKVYRAFASLSVTSFVAGFATSAYAILHFNRMASFGLAGNLLAMPIFTFWVMPTAVAVFPALLFGIEDIPLRIMGEGISAILAISEWVAGWPGAVAYIKAAPNWVIAAYSLSFAALCLGPHVLRLAGGAGILICIGAWAMTPTPDLRVSQEGIVSFWDGPGKQVLYVKTKRADRYGQDQFSRRSGEFAPDKIPYRQSQALCNGRACRTEINQKRVSLVDYPSEIVTECETADIVILTERSAGPVARYKCAALLIDQRTLQTTGSLDIYISKTSIRMEPSLTPARSNRPWGQ